MPGTTAPVAGFVVKDGRRFGLSHTAATSPLALVKNCPGPWREGTSCARGHTAPTSPAAFVKTRLPPGGGANVGAEPATPTLPLAFVKNRGVRRGSRGSIGVVPAGERLPYVTPTLPSAFVNKRVGGTGEVVGEAAFVGTAVGAPGTAPP